MLNVFLVSLNTNITEYPFEDQCEILPQAPQLSLHNPTESKFCPSLNYVILGFVGDISTLVAEFKRFAPAIVDAYFVVDADKTIVDFNRLFYSMLPRQAARGLKGKIYTDVIHFDIGGCIAEKAWEENRHVRLDEITGHIKADPDKRSMRFILSAMPILDGDTAVGALIIQRDVTDEAEVQVKYQEMLETEALERERLATQIQSRTKELLEANQLLLRTQKELLSYKRGLEI